MVITRLSRIVLFVAVIPVTRSADYDVFSDPDPPHPRALCEGTVRHVHIAVGRNPASEMTVSFASVVSKYEQPVAGVLVGSNPGQLTEAFMETEPASSYRVRVTRRDEESNRTVGSIYHSPHYHHVRITGLNASTTYYYLPVVRTSLKAFAGFHLRRSDYHRERLVQRLRRSDGGGSWDGRLAHAGQRRRRLIPWGPYDGSNKACPPPDKVRSFMTAPSPGSDSSVTLAVVGDLGQFPHSGETVSSLLRRSSEIDAILLAGDIAYTRRDHRGWDTFFDFLDDHPVAERVPLQICPGNHDIDKVAGDGGIFLAYENRFRMPRVRPPVLGLYQDDDADGVIDVDDIPYPLPYEWGNAYYAFSYGPARIVMINSYSSMEPNSTQYLWLAEELRSVNRSVSPWLLVVLHAPIYNTFSKHQSDAQAVAARRHLEPLFVRHRVNVVFSGHVHAYLRTSNVVMRRRDAVGPVHVTIGAGGRSCRAPFLSAEPEEWVEVRDATYYGYGVLRILNRTAASWDWVHTGRSDDRDYNVVWDSNKTLPPGPDRDSALIENQYFL